MISRSAAVSTYPFADKQAQQTGIGVRTSVENKVDLRRFIVAFLCPGLGVRKKLLGPPEVRLTRVNGGNKCGAIRI